jgi:tetratricopeptide (TPR) repeat protein
MQEQQTNTDLEKAMAFFERAEEVASTDNFDYAIDMYMEGLRKAPDALEDGHAGLRKIALIRQGKGGKKPSVVEKMKRHGGKMPLEEMLNAEYLLAKDPDNLGHAETMLKAAVAGGYHRTAEWMAHLVFEANRASSKPSLATYLLLKDMYSTLDMFSRAVAACQLAIDLKPDDAALADELRSLSAQMTMQKGKYGQTGSDFRDSIKDNEKQKKVYAGEKAVRSVDARESAVEEAKKRYEQDPALSANVLKYAEVLCGLGTEKGYDNALMLLEKAYKRSQDFTYIRRKGEIEIKKLKSDVRKARNKVKKNPSDGKLKNQLVVEVGLLNKAELEHYRCCSEQYPTDLGLKYDYSLCLIKHKRYDDAIPLLQAAQRDPRRKLQAMDETGVCFFLKGWYADAIDIFQTALDTCEIKDDQLAKDIRYNLARSYEEDGQTEEALKFYRKLAQLDFAYKDVSQRVNKLRNNEK